MCFTLLIALHKCIKGIVRTAAVCLVPRPGNAVLSLTREPGSGEKWVTAGLQSEVSIVGEFMPFCIKNKGNHEIKLKDNKTVLKGHPLTSAMN